jgi:hypothetical protein
MWIVRMSPASSPSGVAFVGPGVADGFKAQTEEDAYRFDSEFEAQRFRDHFRGQYRGFARFDPSSITVETVSARPQCDRDFYERFDCQR